MASTRSFLVVLLAFVVSTVHAQQFEDMLWGVASYPGLSEDCVDAVSTTANDCPGLLLLVSQDDRRLKSDELAELCTTSCRTSLVSVRSTIVTACASDVVEIDAVTYPATFFIDKFIFQYDLSCMKEAVSDDYSPEEPDCSDCTLKSWQFLLNSPFGFDDEFADAFDTRTSSCSELGYSYTTPAPYAITFVPSPHPLSPVCTSPYVVQEGDTCDSIALSEGVPTHAIIRAGSLDPLCAGLQMGASLCLPESCTLYKVKYDETCGSVLAQHPGLDGISLLGWNPAINVLCTNMDDLAAQYICVSPPGGGPGQGTPITEEPPTPTPDVPTAVPKPPNGKDESILPCARWYTIQEGDYCEAVSIRQSLPLQDLYYLNPSIDSSCTNLLLDIAYCVAAVGDINTYPSYPYSTTHPYTLATPTFSTTTTSFSTVAPIITPEPAPLPLAPGSLTDCEEYAAHFPIPAPDFQHIQREAPPVDARINLCDRALIEWGATLHDFVLWNPSLVTADPCVLEAGYRYCALNHTSYVPDPYGFQDRCETTHPAPQSGTTTSCTCFTVVFAWEEGHATCEGLAETAKITVAQLEAWNPWVGSSCDEGLFDGLTGSARRAVCIGTDDSPVSSSVAPSSTSSLPSSTVSSSAIPSSTESNPPPAPTQPGIVANCAQLHTVVSGDGCWDLSASYGISLDRFYEWNPATAPSCGGLWLGYAYCVAISPPADAQAGIVTGCTEYHIAVSGDGCWDIATAYGISLTQFYDWNPATSPSCGGLWLGYAYCVSIS